VGVIAKICTKLHDQLNKNAAVYSVKKKNKNAATHQGSCQERKQTKVLTLLSFALQRSWGICWT
jgi:hypothetical protein